MKTIENTNYAKITNMNIIELAKFLGNFDDNLNVDFCDYCKCWNKEYERCDSPTCNLCSREAFIGAIAYWLTLEADS